MMSGLQQHSGFDMSAHAGACRRMGSSVHMQGWQNRTSLPSHTNLWGKHQAAGIPARAAMHSAWPVTDTMHHEEVAAYLQ